VIQAVPFALAPSSLAECAGCLAPWFLFLAHFFFLLPSAVVLPFFLFIRKRTTFFLRPTSQEESFSLFEPFSLARSHIFFVSLSTMPLLPTLFFLGMRRIFFFPGVAAAPSWHTVPFLYWVRMKGAFFRTGYPAMTDLSFLWRRKSP